MSKVPHPNPLATRPARRERKLKARAPKLAHIIPFPFGRGAQPEEQGARGLFFHFCHYMAFAFRAEKPCRFHLAAWWFAVFQQRFSFKNFNKNNEIKFLFALA